MTERWVNAVIEVRVPLEVTPDATNEEKLEAAGKVWQQMGLDIGNAHTCTIMHETVSDE